MTDDEREAREWLRRAYVPNEGTMFAGSLEADRHRATILALLDAAEAAEKARDAALEEAAQIAERQYPDAIPGAIRSLKGAA